VKFGREIDRERT